ncbi:MAG TPA: hypothetical protein VFP53_01160, partial [Sphingomicrobium sp.]|nr:hypothetical protein [Sphingomicrobium sp.]
RLVESREERGAFQGVQAMANDNDNQDGEGRRDELDQEGKSGETGQQSKQNATGQQGQKSESGQSRQGAPGGQQGQQSEYGQQGGADVADRSGSQEPLGAGHQHSADGGSVTAAGSSSTGPGAGQAGTDSSGGSGSGFVGSQGDNSGEYLQEGQTESSGQAGFAEQGRGAEDEEDSDTERGGERSANRSSDIEGSSDR